MGFPSAHPFIALLGLEGAFVKGLQLEKGKLVKEDNDQYSLICLNYTQSWHQKGRERFVVLPFLWNRFEKANDIMGRGTVRKDRKRDMRKTKAIKVEDYGRMEPPRQKKVRKLANCRHLKCLTQGK